MKATSKTQKRIALAAALVVTLLAVFAGEFTSHGETLRNEALLQKDEEALIERAIEEMEAEYYVPAEEISTTIKVYDADYNLLDIIYLEEGGQIEDEYSNMLLNKAEFLSEYGNTKVYKVLDY